LRQRGIEKGGEGGGWVEGRGGRGVDGNRKVGRRMREEGGGEEKKN